MSFGTIAKKDERGHSQSRLLANASQDGAPFLDVTSFEQSFV
jgi:hypothetical protein